MLDPETIEKALKVVKVTIAVATTAATAAFAVARGTAKAELAPTIVRVHSIERDHNEMRQQLNNVEVLQRYQTKMMENFSIFSGIPQAAPRPKIYRTLPDGGVVEDPL